MKYLFGLIVFLAFAPGGAQVGRDALVLRKFEVDWLTANLNNDREWLRDFSAGKLNAGPRSLNEIDQRAKLTAELLDPTVPDNARKVRITGAIHFVTSDPARNRSFQFLDTFNRRGGKWEVIASSFSPTGDSSESVTQAAAEPLPADTEKEIRRLDMEAAKAILDKDEKAIERYFANDAATNNPRGGLTFGSRGVIELVRAGVIDYHSFDRNVENVQVHGDTAVVMGNETVKMNAKNGSPGDAIRRRYTNVWMKRGANWVIVARHASVIGR